MSSFTKLFPLLLLVWNYDLPSSASAVSWAVIINNVAALEILLDCGYVRAALLAAVGAVCRAGVGWVSSFYSLIFSSYRDACSHLGDSELTISTVYFTRGGSGWWRRCCWSCRDWRRDRALVEVCRECWLGLSGLPTFHPYMYTTHMSSNH